MLGPHFFHWSYKAPSISRRIKDFYCIHSTTNPPCNHNPAILLQTQDLPPVFEENSCIYIFTRDTLLTHRNRLGERPMMFEIDAAEAWDIDDELDFMIVDFLMQQGIRDTE